MCSISNDLMLTSRVSDICKWMAHGLTPTSCLWAATSKLNLIVLILWSQGDHLKQSQHNRFWCSVWWPGSAGFDLCLQLPTATGAHLHGLLHVSYCLERPFEPCPTYPAHHGCVKHVDIDITQQRLHPTNDPDTAIWAVG